jgi:hypothetical protein
MPHSFFKVLSKRDHDINRVKALKTVLFNNSESKLTFRDINHLLATDKTLHGLYVKEKQEKNSLWKMQFQRYFPDVYTHLTTLTIDIHLWVNIDSANKSQNVGLGLQN